MKTISALSLLFVFATSANAGIDEGIAAYDSGDFATALNEFRSLAEQGHADTQYRLGLMYDMGEGVSREHEEAAKWYGKAAEQGHARAQVLLGSKYDFGLGVLQDDKQAVIWYRKASEQGQASGMVLLGDMYSNGRSVQRSNVVAYALFNVAAIGGGASNAKNSLDTIANKMIVTEIEAGQALSHEMMKSGNLGAALDAYLNR